MSTPPFSSVIRTASQDRHTEAEQAPFMNDLLGGRFGMDAFARYTEQLLFVYRALEDSAALLEADPVAGPFLRPELRRVAELERDLRHLLGEEWRDRVAPLPATERYAARVREVAASWPAGYVAHHYTRYLGDLSGGQVIRRVAERTWGLESKGDGVRFYVFEGIDNPAAFKREYRARLDALPVDELEKRRVVEECRLAFTLNNAVFTDLGTLFPATA
ncbi:heme oxygenase (biliverdin-producing) [Streptomyces griseoluteus]|uniref:biliverdin-producing heme oxygenase n=1 Tax=Streptomyces TaxID=1883 RepID=UPI000A3A760E|nr:biliverdin-producing heme oxygenase [Streptomyces recifensis]